MAGRIGCRALRLITATLAAMLIFADAHGEAAAGLSPQPLADALDRFARTTGYQLVYRAELAKGLQTQGADGGLSAVDTLRELLRGTGLTFDFVNARTIAIFKVPVTTGTSLQYQDTVASANSEAVVDAGQSNARCLNSNDSNNNGEQNMAQRGFLMRLAGLFVACGAVLPVGAARAQDTSTSNTGANATLEEIVVTAEKRETSLQSTPVAISVVSGEEIVTQGVTQLDDALKSLAGVNVTQQPEGMSPTIRGVGPNLPPNVGGSAGVSSMFDGVYTNADISSRLGFYDLARIEVLRGPQGTLYGRNAEGGVVGIVSNDPTQKYESSVSAGIGNYDLVNLTGMLNVPLSSSLALRIAGGSVERNGYVSNGQDDNRAQGLRAKLLYQPSDAISLLLGGETTKVSGEGPGTVDSFTSAPSASIAYHNSYPTQQVYEVHNYKVWANLTANVGIGQLSVLPAYQYQSEPKALLYNGQMNVYDEGLGSRLQRSAEVHLASNPGAQITWMLGYFRYNNYQSSPGDQFRVELNSTNNIIVSPGQTPFYPYSYEDSTGVFGQATVPIAERWRIIAGARRSTDDKRSLFTGAGETEKRASWSSTDWKFGGEFDVTHTSMLYATVSTGYRPGGFSPAPPHPAFEPEKLRSYEIGSKNQFLDNTLRVNASVYYYKYSNYQVADLIPCGGPGQVTCSDPLSPFNLDVLNLPVTIRGAELESQYLITSSDTLTATASLLRSRITTSVLIAPPFPAVQLLDESLPNSPTLTFNASYRHGFHLANGATLAPTLAARYASSSYVAIPPTPTSDQSAHWEWDGSLQYAPEAGTWSVNAYVKNATQTVVKSNVIGGAMTLQAPRTYGLAISAHF